MSLARTMSAGLGLLWISLSCPAAAMADGLQLAPYKDALFANIVIGERDGGAFRVVDYQEKRDINGRDAVPERRVQRKYIDMSVREQERRLAMPVDDGVVPFIATGKMNEASVITVFLHGKGGDEELGSRDLIFGGNFNRIRNLMARNGGLYVTPTFADFQDKGAAQIAALIGALAARSPGAPVILACASMGGYICDRLAQRSDTVDRLAGMIYLAAPSSSDFSATAAFRKRLPVFIGHGSRDPVFPIEGAEQLYRRLSSSGTYPVRMTRYESGNHGTPIRMVDWRSVINWILAAQKEVR
ncbi:alpha/beta fold hydrolase [Notoacmeibacter ruber]|uniref:Alpha/beta hydrolase n=1 Tax=Notoacmeibacter ruber TaxID=2670375 RepID=A0A3L7JCL4_9HYPH|nr:alpha/beta fold hydrolase [Notoacmeibacter ruber]RLQ88055.1 alpha/beta hydrolase [Notoacmeibacter ruber]